MATAIQIEDQALLRQIERISVGRQDTSLTKTARDLLREKVTEISIKGDPAAHEDSDCRPPADQAKAGSAAA